MVIFLLSEKFFKSPACRNEFNYVMSSDYLQNKAVPIALFDIGKSKDKVIANARFQMMSVNFVHPTPQWMDDLKDGMRKKAPEVPSLVLANCPISFLHHVLADIFILMILGGHASFLLSFPQWCIIIDSIPILLARP